MPAYRSIVVGTDGSETSLSAVDRAAEVAADSDAELVIVCAYTPAGRQDTAGAEDVLKGEAHLVVGWNPADETLRTAEERAAAVDGAPVDVLRAAVESADAGLLVVGNKGLNTLSGRILGSVPSEVARRSGVDVLIVHTSQV
jgi:nucleotide-binding universal stress UspA family protein